MIPAWFIEQQNKEFNNRKIFGFVGPFRWLSNFQLCNITMFDRIYPSTENAYQAGKFKSKEHLDYLINCTPNESRKYGNSNPMEVDDWDSRKLIVMTEVTDQKYNDEKFKNLLLSTGDFELIEANYWKDKFWGVCLENNEWIGYNNLGKILMEKRRQIRELIHTMQANT